MNYRLLGKTGVKVSALCLGTMAFGGAADEQESARMLDRALEAGVNFIDTADVYTGGRSEEVLGRALADRRDDVVIVSKVHGATGPDLNARGASRRHVVRAVEASLRRLRTDRIDVYMLHRFDHEAALEHTLQALDDLVRRGDVLYVGASNWAAWQTMKALGLSEREGWARFDVIEPMYNLAKRQAEVEILPMAQAEGLGVITFSPLGGGLLSGRYGHGKRPERGRLVDNATYRERYGLPGYFEIADRFVALAAERGVDPVTLAVAWVAAHPAVTAPIVGARSLDQLVPSLDAADLAMDADTRAAISALTPEVPPAHDRREGT